MAPPSLRVPPNYLCGAAAARPCCRAHIIHRLRHHRYSCCDAPHHPSPRRTPTPHLIRNPTTSPTKARSPPGTQLCGLRGGSIWLLGTLLLSGILLLLSPIPSEALTKDPGDISTGDTSSSTQSSATFSINSDAACITDSGKIYFYVGNSTMLRWTSATIPADAVDTYCGFSDGNGLFDLIVNQTVDPTFEPSALNYTFVVPNITADPTKQFSITGSFRSSSTATQTSAMTPLANVYFLQPTDICNVHDIGGTINAVYVVPPVIGFLVLLSAVIVMAWVYKGRLEKRMAKGKDWTDGPRKPEEKKQTKFQAFLFRVFPSRAALTRLLTRKKETPEDIEKGAVPSGVPQFAQPVSYEQAPESTPGKGDDHPASPFETVTNASAPASSNLAVPPSESTPSLTSAASKGSNQASDSGTTPRTRTLYDSDSDDESVRIGPDGRRIHRVRIVYNGTPDRHLGGSSKWRPPQPVGQRHKVVFTFRPSRADELAVARGDVVSVLEYFEDGWVVAKKEVDGGGVSNSTRPADTAVPALPSSVKKGNKLRLGGKAGGSAADARPAVEAPAPAATTGMLPYRCLHVMHENTIMIFPQQQSLQM
ncbi:hypothetical protein HK405_000509 [Cladochytrium tenue]|nr:hypothetical protein HK405_000509 [Cladochytrium tenue]